jgi:hypothetical protein
MARPTCEIVTGWKVAPDGESRGDEIECGKPAVIVDGSTKLCAECLMIGIKTADIEARDLAPLPGSDVEFAIAALKNMGHDVECGACMAVAFTGSNFNAHTCEARRDDPGVVFSSGVAETTDAPIEKVLLGTFTAASYVDAELEKRGLEMTVDSSGDIVIPAPKVCLFCHREQCHEAECLR